MLVFYWTRLVLVSLQYLWKHDIFVHTWKHRKQTTCWQVKRENIFELISPFLLLATVTVNLRQTIRKGSSWSIPGCISATSFLMDSFQRWYGYFQFGFFCNPTKSFCFSIHCQPYVVYFKFLNSKLYFICHIICILSLRTVSNTRLSLR